MKEKILEKSLELFSQRGFDAVSVSMISEGLGISKGALYRHYDSKKAIFDAIINRMEEADYQMSASCGVPEGLFEDMPESYKRTSLENLISFSLSMFIYWTEDGFASSFRKMLNIERFNKPEMNELFHRYLGFGPLAYVEDIFKSIFDEDEFSCSLHQLALEFYGPFFMLMNGSEGGLSSAEQSRMLNEHLESFVHRVRGISKIKYPRSAKYCTDELMSLIMGPNPVKLEEELLENNRIPQGGRVCDLGSGNGLTSVFLAKEYGFRVFACDLWSDPEKNRVFFKSLGCDENQITAVKADALSLPFEKEYFDAVVSVDSYNYFGRDPEYLDKKLLPFVKSGGYIYIAIPGMKKDCHENLPQELLLSWNEEQMDFMHDKDYWRKIVEQSEDSEIISIREMQSNKEVWDDWLMQDNEYAVGDRKSMEAGAGKYLNFIKIILRKK